MNHAELRAAMIERFKRLYPELTDAATSSLVDNALAMIAEIVQQLITDAATFGIDDPESAPAPEV